MSFTTEPDDAVARALATKSYSAHLSFDQLGSLDDETMDLIRDSILDIWHRAGQSSAAMHRAGELSKELAQRVARDPGNPDLADEGISHAREIALADQASAFLIDLATEVDAPAH